MASTDNQAELAKELAEKRHEFDVVELNPTQEYRAETIARRDQHIAHSIAAFTWDFDTAAAYTAALRAEIEVVIAAAHPVELAKSFSLISWMVELPEKAKGSGLDYTETHVAVWWTKLRKVFGLLLAESGGSARKEWMGRMQDNIRKLETLRLELSGAPADEIEAQVAEKISGYTSRFGVTDTTKWVLAFFAKRVPPRFAVEMLISGFLYSVKNDCSAIDDWALRSHSHHGLAEDVLNTNPEQQAVLKPFIDTLDAALVCLPHERCVIFRGVPNCLAKSYRMNTEVSIPSFMTTSFGWEESLNFMDPNKPGTFFILRLHSAAHIDFVSWYPEEAEALLPQRSLMVVKAKTSRTVLRMLRCQFDIVSLVEVGGDHDDAAIVNALVRSAKHTCFVYKNYLKVYVETRVVAADLKAPEKPEPRHLLETVQTWLDDGTPHALLFGDGGTGKTSATLAVQSYLTSKGVFTVFIPLPTVTGGIMTPGALDAYVLDRLDLTPAQFEILNQQHRVVMLLDSLDECGGVNSMNIGTGILSGNPLSAKTRVVLSCRTEMVTACRVRNEHDILVRTRQETDIMAAGEGWETGSSTSAEPNEGEESAEEAEEEEDAFQGPQVSTWMVSEFTDEDIEQFILRSAPNIDCFDVIARFPLSVTRHPLRLQMVVSVLKDIAAGEEDPFAETNDIADVYREYILKRMEAAAACDSSIEPVEMLERITTIAWEMLRSSQWLVSVQNALDILQCDVKALNEMPVRIEDPDDPSTPFTFWHRSIGEYLVAQNLCNRCCSKGEKLEKILKGIHSQTQVGVLKFLMSLPQADPIVEDAIDQLLHHCGAPHSVVEFLRDQLAMTEEKYGPDSKKVLNVLANLGSALGSIGQNHEKRDLLERALAIKETVYGSDNINLANTLNDLANAWGQLGDERRKADMLERSLQMKEREYGKDDYRLATTLNNLGNARGALGNHREKRDLMMRALELKEKHYGRNSFQLASTLNNLGNAYGDLGDHRKKVELMQRAITLKEAHWGPEHFELASSLNNLGNAYGQLGDQNKKRECLLRALELKERHYGPDNYNVASTLHNLGRCFGALGDPAKKLKYMLRAVRLKENHYGRYSEHVVGSLDELAGAYNALGQSDKAREVQERIQQIRTMTQ